MQNKIVDIGIKQPGDYVLSSDVNEIVDVVNHNALDTTAVVSEKADKATTYTKTEVDTLISTSGGGGGESATTSDVVSDVDLGGIKKTDIISSGTTLQSFIESILSKTFYPTLIDPSATLADDIPSTVEIGTTGITLSANFNRGSINGNVVNDVWMESSSQGFRAGEATQYTFSGTYIDTTVQTTSGLELSTEVIEAGVNTFNVLINYNEGQQPKDSEGEDFGSPFPAGTISKSMSVNGKRKAFYGATSNEFPPSDSDSIRALSSTLGPGNGTTFTISAPAGSKHIIFAYPSSIHGVSEVKHVESNFDVSSAFSEQRMNVSSFNNYDDVEYRVYIFSPIGSLDSENNYIITI